MLSTSTSFARVNAKIGAATRDPNKPNMWARRRLRNVDVGRLPITVDTWMELRAVRASERVCGVMRRSS